MIYRPSTSRRRNWSRRTRLPYDDGASADQVTLGFDMIRRF